MKKCLFLVLILFASPVGYASALTVTLKGAMVDVTYTEPTTNDNALLTPVTDLHHTSIYYDLGEGPVKVVDIPASALSGGGLVNEPILIPVSSGEEKNATVWSTATDETGNESGRSPGQTIRIDRLAPSPPQ